MLNFTVDVYIGDQTNTDIWTSPCNGVIPQHVTTYELNVVLYVNGHMLEQPLTYIHHKLPLQ